MRRSANAALAPKERRLEDVPVGTAKPFQFPQNRILEALPAADLRRLAPELKAIPLEFRQSLYKPEQPIRHVCFPDSGVCSVMAVMRSGMTAEVATVGNEGLT